MSDDHAIHLALSTVDEVLVSYSADRDVGLSFSEITRRRVQHGYNELDEDEDDPLWRKYLDQFKDPLIGLLLASAFVSILVKQYDDAFSITLAVAIVSTVAFVQEVRSEQSIAALKQLIPPSCSCVRDGAVITLEARELVPGDIIILSLGDRVPADCRVFSSAELQINESSLTGESALMHKNEVISPETALSLKRILNSPNDMDLNEREQVLNDAKSTMVFMGTTVQNGHGKGLVLATGMKTEFGKTFEEMKNVEQRKTPLQTSMDELGQKLSMISFVVIGGIALVGWFHGASVLDMFTIGVSLAVAAIPEGLPICVTVTLAFGVMRMAKRHAIVKKLPAVEALGCATTICVDKTGTLTCNELTLTHVVLPSMLLAHADELLNSQSSSLPRPLSQSSSLSATTLASPDAEVIDESTMDDVQGMGEQEVLNGIRFTGSGFGFEGDCLVRGTPLESSKCPPPLETLLQVGVICNNSSVVCEPTKSAVVHGQATEAALVVAAEKCGIVKDISQRAWHRIGEDPFSSATKRMVVTCRHEGDVNSSNSSMIKKHDLFHTSRGPCMFMKGSLESVLPCCQTYTGNTNKSSLPLTSFHRRMIWSALNILSRKGLRVLALAHGEKADQLVFDGLVAMTDPPRPGVKLSVAQLQESQSKVVMITGDAKGTAIAIASELGFFDMKKGHVAMSGAEVERLNNSELDKIITQVAVFYRTSPRNKLNIVLALQRAGEVVAMTGDGVNDAPALSAADIGVAMGKSGTDVAKEAADMVILDDDFSTILAAVEEGKCIFSNIKNFLTFQLSTSVAALGIVALANILGLPNPLNAMQILWINIIMDGPPAQSLGVEPVDRSVAHRPPRRQSDSIISNLLMFRVLTSALLIIVGTLWVHCREIEDGVVSRRDTTMTFTTFVLFDLFNAVACKSMDQPFFNLEQGLFANQAFMWAVGGSLVGQLLVIYWAPMQSIFQTEPLSASDLG